MNWDAIGAIGEIVGAGAVVITLLFLITQLRQNTKSLDDSRHATVSQLYQFRAQMHMEGMLRKAEASGLNSVDIATNMRNNGFESLSELEQLFLNCHATADAVRLDNGLFQHQNGFMDDDYRAYIENSIRFLTPYWREIGLLERGGFRQGFIHEVNRIWQSGKDANE